MLIYFVVLDKISIHLQNMGIVLLVVLGMLTVILKKFFFAGSHIF